MTSSRTPPGPPPVPPVPSPAPTEPPRAALGDTPKSLTPVPDTNNPPPKGESLSGAMTAVNASDKPSGSPTAASRSTMPESDQGSSYDSRLSSAGSCSGSGSCHSYEHAESTQSTPVQQRRSRSRARESPAHRHRRSPSPTGHQRRRTGDENKWRRLWPPQRPDRLQVGNLAWNPCYGLPSLQDFAQPWPALNAYQQWDWNAYQSSSFGWPPQPPWHQPASGPSAAAIAEMCSDTVVPATQVSSTESKLRLKIVALECETELLRLQMLFKESSASLSRPTSVQFSDLIKEVYKYLPEDVCAMDEVPSTDRSYGSGVLSQFVPLPKVALPQSSHLRCVAWAVHTALLGVAAPEEVPLETRPSAAAMATMFFSVSGPPPTWDIYRCSQPYFSRDAAGIEANDLREKPPDDLVVKWMEVSADYKLSACAGRDKPSSAPTGIALPQTAATT